jgi:hypothetical protein
MKNLSAILGWLLLLAGLAVYLFGIIDAMFLAKPVTTAGQTILKIPDALETITTSIGAILLTNLGVVLGISVSKPASGLAKLTLIDTKIEVPDPVTMREMIQFAAVLVYVVSLIACGVYWAVKGFEISPDKMVALIPQSAKTLLGVISAYLAYVLAVNKN